MFDVRIPLDVAQALTRLAENAGMEARVLLELIVRDYIQALSRRSSSRSPFLSEFDK